MIRRKTPTPVRLAKVEDSSLKLTSNLVYAGIMVIAIALILVLIFVFMKPEYIASLI